MYHIEAGKFRPCFEENKHIPCSLREFDPNVPAVPVKREKCCHLSTGGGCNLSVNILGMHGQDRGGDGVMWFLDHSPCMNRKSEFPCAHQNFDGVKPGKRKVIIG